MKIPASFSIYGKTWTVTYRSPADERNTNAWAMTSFCDQNIYIDSKLSQQAAEQTFIHECLHIIASETGLDVAMGFDTDTEEKIVNCLANGVYFLLRAGIIK